MGLIFDLRLANTSATSGMARLHRSRSVADDSLAATATLLRKRISRMCCFRLNVIFGNEPKDFFSAAVSFLVTFGIKAMINMVFIASP